MRRLNTALALVLALSAVVWLGSIRDAHAWAACHQLEGWPCSTIDETTLCETWSTPPTQLCTCNGTWTCEPWKS